MEEFVVDVTVAGTGLSATIAAAGLASKGYKVLQIDGHHHYGRQYRTMSIKYLLQMRESRCLNRDRLREQFDPYVAQRQDEERTYADKPAKETSNTEDNVSPSCDTATATEPACNDATTEEAKVDETTEVANASARQHSSSPFNSSKLKEYMDLILEKEESGSVVYYELAPFAEGAMQPVAALEHLSDASSKYGIDLWPKLLLSKSAIIDLLVSSGAHSYLHFTDTKGPMLYGYEATEEGDKVALHTVPNDKNEISRSKLLSPIEKRKFMLLISSLGEQLFVPNFSSLSLKGAAARDDEDNEGLIGSLENTDGNWIEYLRSMGCTQNIVDLLNHGICLGGTDVGRWTRRDGVERLLKYVQSVGLRGEHGAPFIYPLYGTGDIVQAFCRVGAVLGGTQMLGTRIESIKLDEGENIESLTLSNGIHVKTKLLIVDDVSMVQDEVKKGVLRTTGKLARGSYLHIVTMVYPAAVLSDINIAIIVPEASAEQGARKQEPIYVLQTGCDTSTAPENMYLVYLMTVDEEEPGLLTTFRECQHPTVNRLTRCFQSILPSDGNELDKTVMAMYTCHEVAGDAPDSWDHLERHRHWLSGEQGPKSEGANGVVWLPEPRATPVVPLVEEVPIAVRFCDTLTGIPSRNLTPYMDDGIEGFLEVKRKEDPEDSAAGFTAEKLENIMNKYA